MNKRKMVWILPIAAVSAVLLIGIAFWRREAQNMELADDIWVSEENSFHAGDLELAISNKSGDPIYYTTDGSVPTLESPKYETPLFFEASDKVQSCVVRACSFDASTGTWGDLFTRTWFYAKDMEALQERFSTYIVCITSDPYNLYDYEYGILTEGKIRDEYINSENYDSDLLTQPANFTQKGRDWEREAHIELYTAEGERVIDQDAGIRVFGHASRQSYRKSLKLYAREEYGTSRFDYPVFPDNISGVSGEVQNSYEHLVVRNHGTDRAVTLFREELFQTLCGQIEGIDSKSVVPTAVYLNGEYYNFEWIQEVYDDLYMEENYGVRGSGYYEIVTLKSEEEQEELSREEQMAEDDFKAVEQYAEKNLLDDKVFEEFSQLVDVDNMLQYFAIETYIANWDWPQNNVKVYRYYSSGSYGEDRQDGRWRYLYYDMEAGFNLYNSSPEEWRSIQDALEMNELFAAVMQRKDMQEKFSQYMGKCIHEYFTEERVHEAIEQLRKMRDKELQENISYKKSLDETYSMTMEAVADNIEVIYDFVENRPDMVRDEVRELFGIAID